jgi:hypothetical protein
MRFFGDLQGWLYGGATAELKGLAAGFDTTKLVVAMSMSAVGFRLPSMEVPSVCLSLLDQSLPPFGARNAPGKHLDRETIVRGGICSTTMQSSLMTR